MGSLLIEPEKFTATLNQRGISKRIDIGAQSLRREIEEKEEYVKRVKTKDGSTIRFVNQKDFLLRVSVEHFKVYLFDDGLFFNLEEVKKALSLFVSEY